MEEVKHCELRIADCELLQSRRGPENECPQGGGQFGLRKRKKTNRSGIAAVEAALVLPIIMMLLIGTLEYGYLFLAYQQVTNAARQGARTAALADSTVTKVHTSVNNAMGAPLKLGWTANSEAITSGGAPVTDLSKVSVGAEVKVEISLTYQPLTSFLPVPSVIKASVIMSKEGS